MISRKIEKELERFYNSENNKALLITGARQVGKTYSIREFGKSHFESFVELNFLENKDAQNLKMRQTAKIYCFVCLQSQAMR